MEDILLCFFGKPKLETWDMLDVQAIVAYLHFGYIPQVPDDVYQQPWAADQFETNGGALENLSEPQLIAQGVRALKAAFNNIPRGTHIVPLSGGLDSRAILGGLLVAGLKDQITTVTFGTPGTWDYDIGSYVAGQMDVRHEAIDLTKVELKQELLEKTAINLGACTWLFDAFYFYNIFVGKRFGEDAIYWSGFMGEALSGAHLLPKQSKYWNEAVVRFANWNRFVKSVCPHPPDFEPKDFLPQKPFFSQSRLSYDDQLDFFVRQQAYIRNVVLPKGYEYRTPFLQNEWVNFILSVPRSYREKQYLYKEILRKAYPKLFSLPTKNNFGLPLNAPKWQVFATKAQLRVQTAGRRFLPTLPWRVDPMANYIDFDRGLRERDDLKRVVHESLQDLKKRKVVDWVDIDGIWKRHQDQERNHADALTLLTSLEIYLKVNNG